MIVNSFIILICLWLVQIVAGDDGIIELSPETFHTTLAYHENILVVFFAPWCGHCKSLQSDLKRVVTRLKHKNVPAQISTMDGSMYPKFLDRRGVTGFPTFFLYRYGVFNSEYVGERTDRHITDFITRKTSTDIVTRLDSLRQLLAFCSEKEDSLGLGSASGDASTGDPGASFLGSSAGGEDGEGELGRHIYPYLTVHDQMKKEMLSFVLGLFPKRVVGDDAAARENRSKSKGEEAFLAVATEAHDASSFAITDNEWLLEHFEVTEDTVIAFGGGASVSAEVIGRLPLRYSATATPEHESAEDTRDAEGLDQLHTLSDSILEFLGVFSMPLITPFSSTTVSLIDSSNVRTHLLLFLDEDSFGHYIGELLAGLSALAHEHRGKLLFVQISSSEHQILSVFGLTADDYPVVMLADMSVPGNMRRYMMRDSDTVTEAMMEGVSTEPNDAEPRVLALIDDYLVSVKEHIDNFLGGSAKPSIFSAQPGDPLASPGASHVEEDGGVLRHVVGMDFEQAVVQLGGDVLLFIYVPWCAYCKAFETVLKELVSHYTQVRVQAQMQGPSGALSQVTIAKLEGGSNEVSHPGVRIVGYPTLYLFLEGNKTHPVEYDGERSLTAIVEFISAQQRLRDDQLGGSDWKLQQKIDSHKQGSSKAKAVRERRIHEKIQEQHKRAEARASASASASASAGIGAGANARIRDRRGPGEHGMRRAGRRPIIHHNPEEETYSRSDTSADADADADAAEEPSL